MRKLVLILIAFIAVITFITALDSSSGIPSGRLQAVEADHAVINISE